MYSCSEYHKESGRDCKSYTNGKVHPVDTSHEHKCSNHVRTTSQSEKAVDHQPAELVVRHSLFLLHRVVSSCGTQLTIHHTSNKTASPEHPSTTALKNSGIITALLFFLVVELTSCFFFSEERLPRVNIPLPKELLQDIMASARNGFISYCSLIGYCSSLQSSQRSYSAKEERRCELKTSKTLGYICGVNLRF